MSNDTKQNGHAITVRAPLAPLEFSADQLKMIRDTYLNGATEPEAAVLLELARLRRLNPITGQIHFVKRWNQQRRTETWAAQVGIDGFRSMAEETGQYDGQDEPEYEYDAKGAMKTCRVRVYRKDIGRPFVGRADFSEYVQNKKDGGPNHMWATKPHIMLAKCAEALAMRKAFPQQLSGLYAPEEMGEEKPEKEVNDRPKSGSKTQELKDKLAAKALPAQEAPWARIKAMSGMVGLELDELKSLVKETTGRAKPAELTDADVVTVGNALEQLVKTRAEFDPVTGEVHP